MTIDAIHFVYKNKIASEIAISSFRKFYPTSNYVIVNDGGEDYSDLCKKYNCLYDYYETNLGYPQGIYGYNKDKILEFLKRYFNAVNKCKASHIILMEDDVHISSYIPTNNEESLVTENGITNKIHKNVLQEIKLNSGNDFSDDYYAMGGGSIFKRQTFIDNFYNFFSFIDEKFNHLQSFYPQIGWSDCIISLLFLYGGKNHTINKNLIELNTIKNLSEEKIIELFKSYAIIHHYKKYYKS